MCMLPPRYQLLTKILGIIECVSPHFKWSLIQLYITKIKVSYYHIISFLNHQTLIAMYCYNCIYIYKNTMIWVVLRLSCISISSKQIRILFSSFENELALSLIIIYIKIKTCFRSYIVLIITQTTTVTW